ncbi:hypothetical protein [Methyloceanibacter superfactus]|uniref:hypothetical protein n=1 Tax=Methyloceanibacter superfactus TaxID=1774969 RepID=UPI001300E3B9|nr:hypothetical protein [Methyloceanibacter superfactus]
MRRRLYQVAAVAAVLTAGATASTPAFSADLYDTPPIYDAAPIPPQDIFEGWYLGGTIGGASVSYDLEPANGSVSSSGVLGGADRRLQLPERSFRARRRGRFPGRRHHRKPSFQWRSEQG